MLPESPITVNPAQISLNGIRISSYRISITILYNESGKNRPDRHRIVQVPKIRPRLAKPESLATVNRPKLAGPAISNQSKSIKAIKV